MLYRCDPSPPNQPENTMPERLSLLFTALLLFSCATPCLAMDPEGSWKYVEPGYEGVMIISRAGPAYVFTFETTSLSNGQMCDFTTYETPVDQGGGRVDDTLPAMGGTQEDGIRFRIGFKGNEADIDMQAKGMECGMSGYFGGRYIKQ